MAQAKTKQYTNPLARRAQESIQQLPDWARSDQEIIPKARGAAHALPGSTLSLFENTEPDSEAVLIARDLIEAGTLNARRHFAPDALRELGESMKLHGQLQPVIVRPHPTKEGRYQIVSGERRWRAASEKYGDIATLRAIVGHYSDGEVRTLSLIENVNREDLSPLEIARGLVELKDVTARLHWDDVARMVGRSRQWVDRYVALIDAPAPVQRAVDEGRLTPSHARAIRQLDPPQQIKAAQTAIREQMTTRQLEERVRELKAPPSTAIPEPITRTIEPPAVPPSERRDRATARLRQVVSVMAEVSGELMALRLEAGAFSAAYKSEIRAELRLIATQQEAIVAALDGKRPGEA